MQTTNDSTLLAKVWRDHLVQEETSETPAVLYVDLHLIHEVTSPQAFGELRERGLSVRCPDRAVATCDHSTPTLRDADGLPAYVDARTRNQVRQLEDNCAEFGIRLHRLGDPGQGIVHVIGPELGLTWPGRTIVCGDSHTSTHGAFGALAFGIGTGEVAHVLATQCLLQRRPCALRVLVDGTLRRGVTAKDLALATGASLGAAGARGHVIEYAGSGVEALSMDERMTLCNMSIEWGARAGMVGPDDTTFEYLSGRPEAPRGPHWDAALSVWRGLRSDDRARFDREVRIDAVAVAPMVTWGTSPDMAIAVDAAVPASGGDPARARALEYMQLEAAQRILGVPVDVVFIGSCTNSRISDLRAAATLIRGRRVAPGVRMLVVPGSTAVRRAAEQEGLKETFLDAGAEWRDAGCSMCIAMNGDRLRPGQLCVSTSNRNFEGRQGRGGRTILASPLTAVASALAGAVADPRELMS